MEIFTGLLGIVAVVFVLVLTVLAILIPVSAYSAQKYARNCYVELVKMNNMMAQWAAERQQSLVDRE